jgi:excisionase family DNA binding protein
MLTAEVADRLRMSPDRVRDLVRDGVLPARRLTPRGRLLFDEDAVEKVLAAGPAQATADATGQPTTDA